jgi:hypothetical protein
MVRDDGDPGTAAGMVSQMSTFLKKVEVHAGV